ncbi:M60 family metallopeptidase [Xenorhabdus sp. XENO-10]|uniref:M60 family metallopeptidase n=1 Tax=Xenorhabdus yunnanensis TaxID=3025878 RepID=A0ABT5LFM0_9GAMM|nr:M60 family metallopeptidase [Xenorhabdus yunnanensis]MDC9589916.1 M60 family metallopeptidase [Xenorhabdus yunnanensis]
MINITDNMLRFGFLFMFCLISRNVQAKQSINDNVTDKNHWASIKGNNNSYINNSYLNNAYLNNVEKRYLLPALPFAIEESERLRTMKLADYFSSGLYVRKGETIRLSLTGAKTVAIFFGSPMLPVSKTSEEMFDNSVTNSILISSKDNISTFTSPASGMMYFRYALPYSETLNSAKASIKVIEGGETVPFYVAGQTTLNEWRNMLKKYSQSPFIEITDRRSIITVTRKTYNRSAKADPAVLLSKIERIINAYDDISGLSAQGDNKDRSSPLKVHFIEDNFSTSKNIGNAYMYAEKYMIGMPGDSSLDVLNPDRLSSAWGVWHEIGHHYQQDDWLWEPVVETTVNIYSLYVQSLLGFPSLLDKKMDNGLIWNEVAKEFKELKKFPNHNFNSESSDEDKNDKMLWIRLVMFEQLRKGLGTDFYRKLHRYYRHHPLKNTANEEEKINMFALRASLISGFDLTKFFTGWEWVINKKTRDDIKALNLPKSTL